MTHFILGLVAVFALGSPTQTQTGSSCSLEGTMTVVDAQGTAAPPEYGVVYVSTLLPEPATRPATHDMYQDEGKKFEPPVLVVRQGDTVEFINRSHVAHEVHAEEDVNIFKRSKTARATTHTQLFSYVGTSFIGCEIHASMRAAVLTVPNRYHARVAADGSWRIDGLPKTPVTVVFWEPNGGTQTRTLTPCVAGRTAVSVPQGSHAVRKERFGYDKGGGFQ
jgi:plastocyanin